MATNAANVTNMTKLKDLAKTGGTAIANAWRTSLFIEALRNLNWSRSYLWYAELDGVPSPFQRGGVLGLPCKSIQFITANGSSYGFDSFLTKLNVPQAYGDLGTINLSLIEDEKGTLSSFFERWFNNVYNVYKGVLPVEEACKQISIYRLKSTRRHVERQIYSMDSSVKNILTKINNYTNLLNKTANRFNGNSNVFGEQKRQVDSWEFLVYPTNQIPMQFSADGNGLIEFNITLQVVHIINQDFGNPSKHEAAMSFGGVSLDKLNDFADDHSWLSKITDYI